MALFNITIEKVIIENRESDLKELLETINEKLGQLLEDPNGEMKKEILKKLSKAIRDINSTV